MVFYVLGRQLLAYIWQHFISIKILLNYLFHKVEVIDDKKTKQNVNNSFLRYILTLCVARYAAILQNTPSIAMLSLFNIPSYDAPKMTQRSSQIQAQIDTYQHLLPIRPKPLLYPKDSTILTNSRHSSKIGEQLGFQPILVRIRIYLYVVCLFALSLTRKLPDRESFHFLVDMKLTNCSIGN